MTGSVSNLNLINVDISGNQAVGSIAGYVLVGSVQGSSSSGSVTGNTNTGGFVGYNDGSSIQNSYSSCSVNTLTTNNDHIGGFVGNNDFNTVASNIENCYSTGSITATDCDNIGGFAGINQNAAIIQNSYSSSTVNARNFVGGFVGDNTGSTILNCYGTGSVTGNLAVGGFAGSNGSTSTLDKSFCTGLVTGSTFVGGFVGGGFGTSITNSFWDTETSGLSGMDDGDGNQDRDQSGIFGKTTAEMKDWATYTDQSTAGLTTAWDFVTNPNDDAANDDDWDMDQLGTVNNGYPILSWQTGADNILPVELSAFSGKSLATGIRLNWTTQSETNNAGFVLLRNGVEIASYENTAALKGQGTSSQVRGYSYTDADVVLNATYAYQLVSVDYSGVRHSYPLNVEITATEIADDNGQPNAYALEQNYPNPFNPATTISFTMPKAGAASLTVYDMLGRMVHQEQLTAKEGQNSVSFNGRSLTSGMYFYQLTAEGFSKTMKMMLVK